MRSILLTALACWATGIAAVVLTADSSQIAAIFPPAGIAMAAALAVGPRALVGAHLGIMAMMLSSGPVLSAGLGTALATGVAAGFVTAGQAALGAALVRKVLPKGTPPPSEPKRIVCLLVLAGPVTCLASTVVSMGVLLTSGHLPSDLLVATGYRLWVADTLGVTVFLPATLAAVARPRDQWRPLLTTAALPMLLAGAVIATAMTRQEAVERETAEREFVRKSSEAARGFLDQIEQAQLILDATHGYVSASEEVTRAEFRLFTAPLLARAPAIRALGVSWRVTPADRDEFLRRHREMHGDDFEILARGEDNTLAPAPPFQEAMVISLIEPLELNQRALGVDTLPIRGAGESIRRALRSGFQTSTPGFVLTQSVDDNVGVVIYKKLDERGLPSAGAGASVVTRPVGVTFVALEMDALARASFEGLGPGFLHCILDITDAAPSFLAGDGGCPDGMSQSVPAIAPKARWEGEFPMGGRRFALYLEASGTDASVAAGTARAAAMFAALTLAAFLLSLAGRSAEVARLVERRTSELAGEMKIRRRITAALARSEQRLRTLLGSTPAGIVEMTPDQRIVQANPWFHQLVGLREPALVGRSLVELVHPEERDAEARALSTLAERPLEQFQRRFRLLREDGSAISVDAVTSPIRDARGQVVRMVAVIQDLSEMEKRARAEMAREKAEAASRAKTEFVARMSHELRTPLNALLGFAQLLANRPDDPLSDEQAEAVRIIEQSGWHLLDMINDLLELARIESGNVRVEIDRVDLDVIVAESLHLVGSLGTEQGIRVATHIDPSARHVRADPTRLRQVLVNLLSNAIKYNRPGGKVSIESEARADAGTVALRVRDTGMGLTADQLAHLFEPFNRLGRDDTIPGTGIGLAIARNLVELMDGTLEASGAPGEGCCFSVVLPLAEPPAVRPMAPLGRATAV